MNDWIEPLTDAPDDVYEAMDRLKDLKGEIGDLTTRLERLKSERADCQGIVLAHLDANQLQSMNKAGFSFHKIRKLTYASANGDTKEIVDAVLSNPDHFHLLNVNVNKMLAHLKEYLIDDHGNWRADQELVPKDLRSVLNVSERVALGQKASKKK